MKTFLRIFVVFVLFVLSGNLYAQYETALPFLYFNPSPQLNGLGMSGTAYPTNDPAGFYYNPAQLGYISQTNNISLQVYPSNVNWGIPAVLKALDLNYKYRNLSFNLGYNFSNLLGGLNLSAGFGYIHSKFDYGNFYVTGPDSPTPLSGIEDSDEFSAYGLGVGIDYFVQFSIGLTYKQIASHLPAYTLDAKNNSVFKNYTANISAVDFGFLLTVPITKLIIPNLQFPIDNVPASPFLNLSIGYSKLNIAKELSYIDPAQADPLPRTARLGYTISTGLNVKINNSTIKAIGYDFTVDVDDILAKTDTTTFTHSYQGFLGDISIGRNLIGLKSSDNVVVHKGHNISLFETLSFQIGRFDGRGYYNDKSSGFGIQTKGLFTLLRSSSKNNIFNFIVDHLDIQYYSTKLFADSPIETDFKGFNIVWSGMML